MFALTLRTPAHRRRAALFGGAVSLAAALLLFLLNPLEQLGWLRCPLQLTTGLYCPGCGSLRATHALLHGELRAALDLNLLAVLALPLLLAGGAHFSYRSLRGERLIVSIAPWIAWSIFALMLLFTVLRNLPFEILFWLRP